MSKALEPSEFLAMVAELILALEDMGGCMGATANHLKQLLQNAMVTQTREARQEFLSVAILTNELDVARKERECWHAFEELTEGLFSDDELLAIGEEGDDE